MGKVKKPSAAVIEAEAKAIGARGSGYKGIIQAGTEPAAKAISSYFEAEAKKEVARQQAEAQKEVARQQVHAAAVRVNPQMMHELDSPILTASWNAGTVKKPVPVDMSISVLGLFAIGAFAEDIYGDIDAIDGKRLPVNLAARFDANRTPRAEVKGTYVTPIVGGGWSELSKDEKMQIWISWRKAGAGTERNNAYNAAYYSNFENPPPGWSG